MNVINATKPLVALVTIVGLAFACTTTRTYDPDTGHLVETTHPDSNSIRILLDAAEKGWQAYDQHEQQRLRNKYFQMQQQWKANPSWDNHYPNYYNQWQQIQQSYPYGYQLYPYGY